MKENFFITFGILSKKHVILILAPLVHFLRVFLEEKLYETCPTLFLQTFIRISARLINFFPWIFVIKVLAKRTSGRVLSVFKDSDKNQIEFTGEGRVYKLMSQKKKRKKNFIEFLILFGLAIIDFLGNFFQTSLPKLKTYDFMSGALGSLCVLTRTLIICLLYRLIFPKQKIYSHQILCIIVVTILVIIEFFLLLIPDVYNKKDKNSFSWEQCNFLVLLSIIPELFYSIYYVCGAKYIFVYYKTIFKLLSITSLIEIILFFILQIFVPMISCPNDSIFVNDEIYNFVCNSNEKYYNLINDFKNLNGINIFLVVITIIVEFFLIDLFWETVVSFTPNHLSSIYAVSILLRPLITGTTNNYKIYYSAIYYIFSTIIIIMTLVLNEIIILHFCRLDYNTRYEIQKRSELDEEEANYDEINENINDLGYDSENENQRSIENENQRNILEM